MSIEETAIDYGKTIAYVPPHMRPQTFDAFEADTVKGCTVERFTRIDLDTGAKQTGIRVGVTLNDGSPDRSSTVWMNNTLIDACDFSAVLPLLTQAMAREIADRHAGEPVRPQVKDAEAGGHQPQKSDV